jgi:hypothetical protein
MHTINYLFTVHLMHHANNLSIILHFFIIFISNDYQIKLSCCLSLTMYFFFSSIFFSDSQFNL